MNVTKVHLPINSAMVVGIDLAKFHLQMGDYKSAEVLLEKAWAVYRKQKWHSELDILFKYSKSL